MDSARDPGAVTPIMQALNSFGGVLARSAAVSKSSSPPVLSGSPTNMSPPPRYPRLHRRGPMSVGRSPSGRNPSGRSPSGRSRPVRGRRGWRRRCRSPSARGRPRRSPTVRSPIVRVEIDSGPSTCRPSRVEEGAADVAPRADLVQLMFDQSSNPLRSSGVEPAGDAVVRPLKLMSRERRPPSRCRWRSSRSARPRCGRRCGPSGRPSAVRLPPSQCFAAAVPCLRDSCRGAARTSRAGTARPPPSVRLDSSSPGAKAPREKSRCGRPASSSSPRS